VTNPLPRTVAEPSARHIPELDGIRAIAIWLVLATHLLAIPPVDVHGIDGLPEPIRVVIEHGWLGVDLFFVLSGFLITGILLRAKGLSRGEYFRRFYVRRAVRILPVYFVVLFAIGLFAGAVYLPYLVLCSLMAANLSSLVKIAVPAAAGPYWSLAVEEQFYLIWPWLVLWLGERWLIVVAIAILVAEPIIRIVLPGSNSLTWYRADGLAMGSFLAAWFSLWRGDRRSATLLVVSLLCALAIITIAGLPLGIMQTGSASDGFRITQAILAFGALVAASVAFSGAPIFALLRTPVAVTTAALSYCIYLVHRPLLDVYDTFILRMPVLTSLTLPENTSLRAIVVVAASYAVAIVSRKYLELPLMRLGRGRGAA
jgi:peptidoglycan/LPS O-acetylase OafA/YrhL